MPPLKRDHSRSMDYSKICSDSLNKVARSEVEDSEIMDDSGINASDDKNHTDNNHSPTLSRKSSGVNETGTRSCGANELSPQ